MPESVETLRGHLERALAPEVMEVEDESELHRGHAGWRPGGGTHFRVRIVAACFRGVSRLDRHRLVHDALAEPLAGSVHALSIEARSPEETNAPPRPKT